MEREQNLSDGKRVATWASGYSFAVVSKKRAGLGHVILLCCILNPKQLERHQGVYHNFDLAARFDELGKFIHGFLRLRGMVNYSKGPNQVESANVILEYGGQYFGICSNESDCIVEFGIVCNEAFSTELETYGGHIYHR